MLRWSSRQPASPAAGSCPATPAGRPLTGQQYCDWKSDYFKTLISVSVFCAWKAGYFKCSQMVQPSASRPSRRFFPSSSRRSPAFRSAILWLKFRLFKDAYFQVPYVVTENKAILKRWSSVPLCCAWKKDSFKMLIFRSFMLWWKRTLRYFTTLIFRSFVLWMKRRLF